MGSVAYDPRRSSLYSPELRETVFVPGKTYSDVQIAIEAARLAYIKAEGSAHELQRLTDTLRMTGFEAPQLLHGESTETRAFASVRPQDAMALVAFRGTQPDAIQDLVTDSKLLLTDWPESGGRVHQGFAAAFRSIRPHVERWLNANGVQGGRLIVTGHSLGAALATLGASVWSSGLLLTLGSPRVGNARFVNTCNDRSIVRLVDCCDLVTDIPLELGGYRHAGSAVYITASGHAIADPSPAFVAKDRMQGELDYAKSHSLTSSGNVLLRRLADHAPVNYARAFF